MQIFQKVAMEYQAEIEHTAVKLVREGREPYGALRDAREIIRIRQMNAINANTPINQQTKTLVGLSMTRVPKNKEVVK